MRETAYAIAFMITRRRWLQALFLICAPVNLGLAAVMHAPRVILVADASLALTSLALVIRKLLWPNMLAGAFGVAVVAYAAGHQDFNMFALGVLGTLLGCAGYVLCVRWRRALEFYNALRALSPLERAEAFHGLATGLPAAGLPSYERHLQNLGVPLYIIACVEELCEEKLSLTELADLRSRVERRRSSLQ